MHEQNGIAKVWSDLVLNGIELSILPDGVDGAFRDVIGHDFLYNIRIKFERVTDRTQTRRCQSLKNRSLNIPACLILKDVDDRSVIRSTHAKPTMISDFEQHQPRSNSPSLL